MLYIHLYEYIHYGICPIGLPSLYNYVINQTWHVPGAGMYRYLQTLMYILIVHSAIDSIKLIYGSFIHSVVRWFICSIVHLI